jgi:6-phosphogluconolactonase
MRPPVVTAWHDPDALAEAVAARLVTRLVTTQADRGHAGVVLTGGRVGIAVLAALARSPGRDVVDWSALDVWWGDERFVPADDPDRNEGQARRALLDHVPVDPARVHPMPASSPDETGDVHAAAEAYAEELARHADLEAHAPLPHLDVLLLGVGEDGHVASLFPGSPALADTGTVVGVEGAPKPPPRRVSLTLRTIRSADEVWLVAAGDAKAAAVALALGGGEPQTTPAAAARGRLETCWLLDRAAAAALPRTLVRPV